MALYTLPMGALCVTPLPVATCTKLVAPGVGSPPEIGGLDTQSKLKVLLPRPPESPRSQALHLHLLESLQHWEKWVALCHRETEAQKLRVWP